MHKEKEKCWIQIKKGGGFWCTSGKEGKQGYELGLLIWPDARINSQQWTYWLNARGGIFIEYLGVYTPWCYYSRGKGKIGELDNRS